VCRFAGLEGWFGQIPGLENTWALRADRNASNYAEICERNLDIKSPRDVWHGLNQF
jgi:general L-amino acid transport system substrate-binding protein